MFQKVVLLLSLLVIFSIPQIYALTTENHVAIVQWEQASYPAKNTKAKIIVDEPDMNKFPQSIDRFDIRVFSDSDSKGITLRVTETSVNSGIFETIVILTTDPSKENRLHTVDGDTITAKYVDTTLPKDHAEKELEITGTAFSGSTGPPLERVLATDLRLYNTKGNRITELAIDQQVEIIADLRSSEDRPQKFAYLAQITNEKNETILLSWIDGILDPLQALSPSISWIPNKPSQYMATVFVWESMENPTALSPPLSIDLKVIPKQFDGKEFINEKFVKITLLDYKYSYTTKEHINFGVKLEGYYDAVYPPKISVRDGSGKTVWDNTDFVRDIHFERTNPVNFSERYDMNNIGGPIHLKGGKYTLNVKFEDWNIQRDLFVR